MFQLNTENLVEAVKSAKSVKMALDGTNLLLGDSEEYRFIFKEVFELAWQDATRRNRAIERSAGKKRDIKWKPRTLQTDEQFETDLLEFNKTGSTRKKNRILGRILSDYEEQSIKRFFAKISVKEEV